ncbi:MAG: putative two-component sensor histidine kinase [Polaromonas sp.]|nr:putative two-component sensor histidine kinase [Polaromonas sp.]
MKLPLFITTHLEDILVEWDIFAKTLFPASPAPQPLLLRDHAKEILQELVLDIERHQTAAQQKEKSEGQPEHEVDRKTAAAIHGTLRQASGFSLIQLTSEYRALRATVFRLWTPHMAPFTPEVFTDITRFNEAMDQALAESVVTYSENADRTRDTFLAILGHDLRSPLSTISMAGSYLTRAAVGSDGTRLMGARVARSAATMTAMVNDLLEYARTQLGGGIPLTLRWENLHDICQAALDDAQAGHPDCPFELQASGDLFGSFDRARLQQLVSNLLNNAAQYRADTHPVVLTAHGEADAVRVEVRNLGPVIPAQSLQAIFDPLVQLAVQDGQQKGAASSSLGLGLFIAREITGSHGGTISAASSAAAGTVFTVMLPRMPPEPQAK